ncbi:diacylglycerol kinase family protein [Ornithinibacillus bavariensis]|uniref:Undecaprenol kinase n=1 Tax=Ornithinibacillus bavariensis TaxID=545502 RepID=A0A919X9Z1_9BACI|nr:diacylglycerol kinase family protein [Ornithinibacillus bavariensis]GIO27578.1 undecaprenol kinase [Ornithinibacillus bavariensis]HAM81346.1 diacylglycerol kinase [Ornithinibacillus sp.]
MADKKKSIGFTYAFSGLKEVFKSERNFRFHIISAILVIIAGFLLGFGLIEWMIAITVIGLVMTAEILNTAIEEIINYLRPEIHPAAKKIKDLAAAGVFIAAVTAFVVGLLLFLPKLF